MVWSCMLCTQRYTWSPYDEGDRDTAYALIDAHTAAHIRSQLS